jgi:hypothetical protein
VNVTRWVGNVCRPPNIRKLSTFIFFPPSFHSAHFRMSELLFSSIEDLIIGINNKQTDTVPLPPRGVQHPHNDDDVTSLKIGGSQKKWEKRAQLFEFSVGEETFPVKSTHHRKKIFSQTTARLWTMVLISVMYPLPGIKKERQWQFFLIIYSCAMSGDVIPAGPKRPPHTVIHRLKKRASRFLFEGRPTYQSYKNIVTVYPCV